MTNNYQLLEVVYTTVHDNYKTEYKINIIEQIAKSFDNGIPNRYKKLKGYFNQIRANRLIIISLKLR